MRLGAVVWILLALGSTPARAADPAAPERAAERAAPVNWKVVREDDGVVSSRRTLDGALPAFRAETTVDAGVLEVLAILQDDGRRTEWMARCIEARRLAQRDRWTGLDYSRLSSPWPLSPRDVVVESRTRVAPDAASASVDMRSVDAPSVPTRGASRIEVLEGVFRLSAEGPGRTRVVYELALDLGGGLPQALVRRTHEAIPFDTLRALHSQVERTRGLYVDQVAEWREVLASDRGR